MKTAFVSNDQTEITLFESGKDVQEGNIFIAHVDSMNKIQKQLYERAKPILHCGFTPIFEIQSHPKGLIIAHDFAVGHDSLEFLIKNFNVTLMKGGRLFIE